MTKRINTDEAFLIVVALAERSNNPCDPKHDEAIKIIKRYARVEYGLEFPGDNDAGAITLEEGQTVIFIALSDNPPAGRYQPRVPVRGEVVGFTDDVNFPFLVRIGADEHKASVTVAANRRELQPVAHN